MVYCTDHLRLIFHFSLKFENTCSLILSFPVLCMCDSFFHTLHAWSYMYFPHVSDYDLQVAPLPIKPKIKLFTNLEITWTILHFCLPLKPFHGKWSTTVTLLMKFFSLMMQSSRYLIRLHRYNYVNLLKISPHG